MNTAKANITFLHGSPFGGKTKLVQKLGGIHLLSMSGILKTIPEANARMRQGVKVPDTIVLPAFFDAFNEISNRPNGPVCIDGFPRYQSQLEAFIERFDIGQYKHLHLKFPRDVIIARINGRRICSNSTCNSIYHLTLEPPRKEGKCDNCGAELIVRCDDDTQTVLRRLDDFEENTAPVIEIIRQSVNGSFNEITNPNIDAMVASARNIIFK